MVNKYLVVKYNTSTVKTGLVKAGKVIELFCKKKNHIFEVKETIFQ